MADTYSVVAKLSADVSQFTKGFADAQSSLRELQKEADKLSMADKFQKVGSTLSSVGKTLSIGITAPLAAVGTAAVKTGADFEKQMNRVKAISGTTGKDFEALRQQAIDLGASSVFSATEVAQAQEMMASAGMSANEILAASPGIMDLAAVSGGDMALASEAAASSLNQFGLSADQAGHVADIFARAAADTNAETTDMAKIINWPVAEKLAA